MSLFALALYVPFNQDVSLSKYGRSLEAEAKAPFSLSAMYISRMTQTKLFLQDYICLNLWGFASGAVMYYIWYMFERSGGILNQNGDITDLESFGVFNVTITSVVAHIIIIRYIRHWDPVYTFCFLFSIAWIPFNLWDEGSMPESRVQGAMYSYMFANGPYVLSMLLIITVICMPLVLTRFRRTYWLEPHLYCVE